MVDEGAASESETGGQQLRRHGVICPPKSTLDSLAPNHGICRMRFVFGFALLSCQGDAKGAEKPPFRETVFSESPFCPCRLNVCSQTMQSPGEPSNSAREVLSPILICLDHHFSERPLHSPSGAPPTCEGHIHCEVGVGKGGLWEKGSFQKEL